MTRTMANWDCHRKNVWKDQTTYVFTYVDFMLPILQEQRASRFGDYRTLMSIFNDLQDHEPMPCDLRLASSVH